MSDETENLQKDVRQTANDAVDSFNQLKDNASRVAQSAAEAGRAGYEQIKGKIGESQETLRNKINDGRDAVAARINDGKAAVAAKYADSRAAVHDAADRVKARGNDLRSGLSQQIEQNPLQAIAIAAGVGVVVGLLLRR